MGVDLGQKRDHTAIAVVERRECLLVRHVERVALGTPYPFGGGAFAGNGLAAGIARALRAGSGWDGFGRPVVDMLRGAGLGCEITAVTISGGERERKSSGLSVSVPKRDLIAGVQVALENGDLRIARSLKELGPLVRELVDVRVTSGAGMGKVRAKRRENGYTVRSGCCEGLGKDAGDKIAGGIYQMKQPMVSPKPCSTRPSGQTTMGTRSP